MASKEIKRLNPSSRAMLEPLANRMKIGLFGGSFNPAHIGHLHLAQTAKKRLGLHKVLWLVSPGNPLKSTKSWENYSKRLQSTKDITEASPAQIVCESEKMFATRYTIDTINGFKRRWPSVDFVWLIGADNLRSFHLWRNWQQIVQTIPIAIISRPDDPVRARLSPFARQFAKYRLPQTAAKSLISRTSPAWVYLSAPHCPVSSTAIRQN
ncbi:MAG: nicotinate (nicotinamide) nucleotide adenylyltransferase [Robiginitomaculum sp.]|nr:nicotinate (nicotinamide) nucleotide adenylyltransferase [Robiginitomaculum sp.]